MTEHQLSAHFRPDEIIRSGWDFHAVSDAVKNLPRKGHRGQRHRGGLALLTRNSKHFSVRMKSLIGVVNKITGDECKCMDKRRGGHGLGSGSLPILHQAVTWSLTSPLYNDTIHLTGVYIFRKCNHTRLNWMSLSWSAGFAFGPALHQHVERCGLVCCGLPRTDKKLGTTFCGPGTYFTSPKL